MDYVAFLFSIQKCMYFKSKINVSNSIAAPRFQAVLWY